MKDAFRLRGKTVALALAPVLSIASPAHADAASDGALFDAPEFIASYEPIAVALGDLNDDGYDDLAAAYYEGAGVGVFLSTPGGGWTLSQLLDTGESARAVAIAELDGDKNRDLIVATDGGFFGADRVLLYFNLGGGVFGAPVVTPSGSVVALAAGDLDGDGDEDVVFAQPSTASIRIEINDGAGTLTTLAIESVSSTHALALSDVDADGDLDVLCARSAADLWTILFNAGDGTVALRTDYDGGNQPEDIAVADVDGDGDLDVAVPTAVDDLVQVWLNDGAGVFAPGATVPALDSPRTLAFTDVDADGTADLAVGLRSFPPTLAFALNDGAGVFTAAPELTRVVGQYPFQLVTGNADGAGPDDLALACVDGDEVTLFLIGADGIAADRTRTPIADGPGSVAVADLDGDGDRDVVACANGEDDVLIVLANDGAGTLAVTQALPTGTSPRSVAVGLIDGDAFPDAVVANAISDEISLYLNQGDGTFAPAVQVPAGNAPDWCTLADLDGDGAMDIAAANSVGDNVSVFIGDGAGGFGPFTNYSAGNGSRSIVAGDFDGDAKPDLATANYVVDTVAVLFGTGGGAFAAPVAYGVGNSPFGLAVGDLDGDGDIDLVTADELPASEFEGSSHTVLLNDGAGVFAVTQYVLPFGGYPAVPVIADLDGDGVVDIAASHYGPHDVLVRLGNGDGTFSEPFLYDSAAGAFGLAAGDMNGDGGIDLVVTGYDGDEVVVLENRCPPPCDADIDGDGGVGFGDLLAVLSSWGPCEPTCPADLDGDGDVDFDDLLIVLSSWGPCAGWA